MKRLGTFLTLLALTAGMGGCFHIGLPLQSFEIRTWYDLDAVRKNLSGRYILMNDLDSATPGYEELASPTANEGKGWNPIGVYDLSWAPPALERFCGTFDGQRHTISDLYIERVDESGVGLFAAMGPGGNIRNVALANSSVAGGSYVGALVAWNYKGTVCSCYFDGNVTGDDYVGGLLGGNAGAIRDSHSRGSVIGSRDVGGLVGWNYWAVVSNSYSSSRVAGHQNVGGLVGQDYGGSVSNSYAAGSVSGNSSVGGLVGDSHKCNVRSSFWDTESSGTEVSDGGTGKTTAEMQDVATFRAANWDITPVHSGITSDISTWNIVSGHGYPFLSGRASCRLSIAATLGIVAAVMAVGTVILILLKRRRRAA